MNRSSPRFTRLALHIATLLYPCIVFLCYYWNAQGMVGIVVAFLLASRIFLYLEGKVALFYQLFATLGVALATLGITQATQLFPLFLPVIINFSLLGTFGISLFSQQNVIERIARSMKGELPPEGVQHCRRACIAWCLFFLVNGCIALDSVRRDITWWSLYNGCISYCAMGGMFLLEYLVRIRTMKRVQSAAKCGLLVIGATFRFSLSCFALSCISLDSIIAQTLSVSELQQKLDRPSPFKADFTERKVVKVLSAPLESKGTVLCLPGEGIVWNATFPFARTFAITRTGIYTFKGGKVSHATTDRAGISDAMLSLLSGDIAHTEQRFNITSSGTTERWTVTLTPRDSLVSQLIQGISVNGGEHPQHIEVSHENGDKVITSFSPPTPIAHTEISSTRELLNAAAE